MEQEESMVFETNNTGGLCIFSSHVWYMSLIRLLAFWVLSASFLPPEEGFSLEEVAM